MKRSPSRQLLAVARLAVCERCVHLRRTRFGRKCAICACYVALKANLKTQSCPIALW